MWQKNQTTLTKIGIIFLLVYGFLVEKPYLGDFNQKFRYDVAPVEYRSYSEIHPYDQGKMRLAVENPVNKRDEVSNPNPQVAMFSIQKPTGTPEATPTPQPSPIATRTPVVVQSTPEPTPTPDDNINVEEVIRTYAGQYNVDSEIMIAIAHCESGLRSNAVNGQYAGIFQFHPSTWASNRRAMGEDESTSLRFNPVESAKTAAFKMSRDGFGAWPECSRKALIAIR